MQSKISKKIIVTLCMSMILFIFTGCNLNKSNCVETTIDAKVIENDLDNNQLIVAGIDNSSIVLIGDKCVVSCKDIKIFNRAGEEIDQDNIKLEDIVTIMYGGGVQESYPTKITSIKWIQISK